MKGLLNTAKVLTVAVTAAAISGAFPTAASAEPSLEDLLDQIGVPETTVESGAEKFQPVGGKTGMATGLLFEFAGFRNHNAFGVYNVNTPNEKYELIAGSVNPGEQTLSDKWFGYNEIFKNFGDTFEGVFGFYLDSKQTTFYSQAALNPYGFDHFKAFEGDGVTKVNNGLPATTFRIHDWVIGFEDLKGGGDQDYNDFVAYVRQAEAVVPEPTMILGLAAFAGGAFAIRRRQSA